MPIDGLSGLTEFSQAQYTTFGRRFEGEKNFNAPSLEFLKHRWKVAIGTVGDRVYKIALSFETDSMDTVMDLSSDILAYCQLQLGCTSEQQETIFVWDAPDGNVVLQFERVGSTYMIDLFETSSSINRSPLKSESRAVEWRMVPIETGYWHPVNRGFTHRNAKFMCSECGTQVPLPVCPDCGCERSQLGTTLGIPGVFCEQCNNGGISWACPTCSTPHKAMLVFYYDIHSIKVRKKRFWE
jgi:hypothetical protein